MSIELKKKRIRSRILSAILFISVFMTSIMFHTMPAKAEYFRKIGDKVYFRKFGKNALPKTADWAEYLAYPTGEKGSFIAVYDNTTKEVSKAFDDAGGEFYYMNERFFMQHKDTVYSVDENGNEYEELTDKGDILGCFNKEYLVVNEYKEDNQGAKTILKSIIYKNGEKDSEWDAGERLQFSMKTDGRYAIYREFNYYDNFAEIWCKDLKSKKAPVLLGRINLEKLRSGTDTCELLQMKRKKSDIYFSISLRTGNMGYLAGGCVYKANPNKKNSLKLMTKNLMGEIKYNGGETYYIKDFDVDGKGRVKTFSLRNTTYLNGKVLYFYDSKGKKKLITNDLLKLLKIKATMPDEYTASAEAYIDGNLFMMIDRNRFNEGSVGERYEYDIIERYYVRIPVKNPKGIQIMYKDVFK